MVLQSALFDANVLTISRPLLDYSRNKRSGRLQRSIGGLRHDGKPLTMEELADADLDFAPFWNKLKSAQCVVVSLMIAGSEERPSQKVLDTACGEDGNSSDA